MGKQMKFNSEKYTIETAFFQGEQVSYQCYWDLEYARHPANPIQKMNLYVPCSLYGESSNELLCEYSISSAPILLPNTVGGYVPGERKLPGISTHANDDMFFRALQKGIVVASVGVRGRGMSDGKGGWLGMAPAAICDLKAAVRYLKYNAEEIPGNTERIISSGISAGGALSALLGATGDHPDYEEELCRMGACPAGDSIFAASCYCPITNLENADMAYEWEFGDILVYRKRRRVPDPERPGKFKIIFNQGTLTPEQIRMSGLLRKQFYAYVSSLGIEMEELESYIKNKITESIQKQIDTGMDMTPYSWIQVRNNRVVDIDFEAYIRYRTRMKDVPAFDQIDLSSPENNLFGTSSVQSAHFTEFSSEWDGMNSYRADGQTVKMMNPMEYIRDGKALKAKYFRIRHGMLDRDTSLAVSALLAMELEKAGYLVDFSYPWGVVHDGDYDLDAFFEWVREICMK